MIQWRVNFILIILILFGAALIGRLFYLQINKSDFYKALAQGFYSTDSYFIGERGRIFFRNGEPLAVNIDRPFVFASPLEIEEKEKTAQKLSQALLLDEGVVLEKLQRESLHVPIKRRLTDEEIEKINSLGLRGIYLGREKGRYYPQEMLASQLVGFVDFDSQGQYGIEGYYDEVLRGKRNQAGQDIFLTIDYAIQHKAEEILKRASESLRFIDGEIIVINPSTGEILALANYPNFNPNEYSKITDFTVFKNSSTQKIFEPGSIFKPITIAAALEEKKITPQTTYIDTGSIKIGGRTIRNYSQRTWGEQSMTEVLEKSINTGVVVAERKIGHDKFLSYLYDFGFFEPTGIDFTETYSQNTEFKKGYEINFATASFGQGIELTPIQLIRSFGVIANDGNMTKPFLVKKIADGEGFLESEPEIKEDKIISSKTAAQLTAMMVSVTENGFAKSARVPGYYVAGKTGTAQIAWSAIGINQSGYSDRTWQSFVGYAPAFNPEFVILVKLNNPQARTAEYSAAPMFQELAKYILDYYQVPPDYEE